jgi:hypothetical protein
MRTKQTVRRRHSTMCVDENASASRVLLSSEFLTHALSSALIKTHDTKNKNDIFGVDCFRRLIKN